MKYIVTVVQMLICCLMYSQGNCLVAEYELNGSGFDVSGHGHHGMVKGASAIDDQWGNPLFALDFDGINDEVTLNQNQPLISGSEFTIFGWARIDGTGGGLNSRNILFSQRGASTGIGVSIVNLFLDEGTGLVEFVLRDDVSGPADRVNYPAPVDNQWHCYAATVDGMDTMSLFIDGMLVASGEHQQNGNYNININSVALGGHHYNSQLQAAMNGAIDGVKIYDCPLSKQDILDLCLTSSTCIQAHYQLDGNAIDNTGNGFDGNITGGIATQDQWGNSGSAMLLDGINDEIILNNNNAIISNSEFTICGWARIDGPGGGINGNSILFSQRGPLTTSGNSIINLFIDQGGLVEFVLRDNVNGSADRISYTTPGEADWHCYAVTVDSTDTMRLYLDGLLVAADAHTQNGNYMGDINSVTIGSHHYSGQLQAATNGAIDEVKLYNCALSIDSIASLCEGAPLYSAAQYSSNLLIYPNPAKDYMVIKGLSETNDDVNICLMDIWGRVIKQGNNWDMFDIKGVESGVYNIQINISGEIFNYKVIISQ